MANELLKLGFFLGLCGAVALHYSQTYSHMPTAQNPATAALPLTADEQSVMALPISGPLADRDAEISGLDWYGDWLILLPQYPERLSNHVFALSKGDILSFINGQISQPLSPKPISFQDNRIGAKIEGFEGYEAISFRGNQAFLTIEAEANGSVKGYVVKGTIAPNLGELVIDSDNLAISPAQSSSPNKADEALLLTEDRLISIYEVSGAQVNPAPQMHAFDFDLGSLPSVSFPTIEYRITDATQLDGCDRFWAINYFYEGDRDLLPTRDPLVVRYGRGRTHRQQPTVERLVEFTYSAQGIALTDTAPIQLELIGAGRNWEGIARLDDQGFLIATDKFPETLIGFVPRNLTAQHCS
ncbi:MAG: hypothetical protein AAGB19_13905 [Cyanobacteria bacterium P01_F01_bin.3]